MDVYLNIAGGLRISEPAADLAVAAALISARQDHPIASDTIIFGEISLSGALRPVGQPDSRLREAEKLGFQAAITPSRVKLAGESGITVHKFDNLTGFIDQFFGTIET